MCSQDFLRSVRFLETVFFPECVGTSSEQYRKCDHHQLLARENVPRFSGNFWSKLTLAIEFEAHKRVPWLRKGDKSPKIYDQDWFQLVNPFISYVETIYQAFSHCISCKIPAVDELNTKKPVQVIEAQRCHRSGSVVFSLLQACLADTIAD